MTSDEEVSDFIQSSFRSVWSLELLLLLKREPRLWSRAELVSTLRASDLIVAQGLEALTIAGLAMVDEAENAAYRPASDDLARLAEGTDSLYARSPAAVRRLIVGALPNPLSAFAEAFKLRKE